MGVDRAHLHPVVRNEARREQRRAALGRDRVAVRRAHHMGMPGRQAAVLGHAGTDALPAVHAVVVVAHVHLARADQLDGHAGMTFRKLARDGHRVEHEVDLQPPPEAAADARDLHRELGRVEAEGLLEHPRRRVADLAGRDQLHPPIGKHGGHAAMRLQGGVGKQRERVAHVDALRAVLQRLVHVAVVAPALLAGLAHQLLGLLVPAGAARAIPVGRAPLHLQAALRLQRRPGIGGDDRHAPFEAGAAPRRALVVRVRLAGEQEGVDHAGQLADRLQIGGQRLGAEHRRLLQHRHAHAGQLLVQRVKRLAVHDGLGVQLHDRLTDQLELAAGLEAQARGVGQGQPGGLGGELRVTGLALAGRVRDLGPRRAQLAGIDLPALRRRLHQQPARHAAGAAQRLPGVRDGAAAARPGVELARVPMAVLDLDLVQTHIQLLGQQHQERGLHALAHLGVLGGELDAPAGLDADQGAGAERAGVGLGLGFEHQAAAGERRQAQLQQLAALHADAPAASRMAALMRG